MADDAAPAPPAAAPERASPGGGYGSSYKGGLRGTPSIIKRKLESYQKDLAAGKKPTKSAEKAKSTKVAKPAAAKPMSLAGAVLAALVAFALIGGLVFQVYNEAGRSRVSAPTPVPRARGRK